MNINDYLIENDLSQHELTRFFIQFYSSLQWLHNHGFCVYDFDLKKIYLINGVFKFESFKDVINDINIYQNVIQINILQLSKLMLLSFNKLPLRSDMNQEHFNYIATNLFNYNQNGQIPEEIYQFLEDVYINGNIDYLNNYLVKKAEQENSRENTVVKKKVLSTAVGRALVDREQNAFINILFIPTIISFIYLTILFIYTFIFK